MAKAPRPGSTKTRLVPPLSAETAAQLYECFLLDSLDHVRSVPNATPLVAVWPTDAGSYFTSVAPDFGQILQQGDSLNVRLDYVLTTCLERGFDRVVAINSDSPTLPNTVIGEAFHRLDDDEIDMVLGPADDGGYYLIGWKRPYSKLVRGVEMSTPNVLADTLELATQAGVSVSLLDPWYDVDDASDLRRLGLEFEQPGHSGFHTRRFMATADLNAL